MVRWLAQIRTGPSLSLIMVRYRFLSSAAFLTRYLMKTRMMKTIVGIQTIDENRPTSRWRVNATLVRRGRSLTLSLGLGNSRGDQLHGIANRIHGVGIFIFDSFFKIRIGRRLFDIFGGSAGIGKPAFLAASVRTDDADAAFITAQRALLPL